MWTFTTHKAKIGVRSHGIWTPDDIDGFIFD